MAGSAVIGALRVTLGIDTAAFKKGLNQSQKELAAFGKQMAKIGSSVKSAGQEMSVGITAPLAVAGGAIIKFAGDFEASMNRVGISTQAGAAEMKAMNDLALDLGKSTVFSASEAADAMDMLAKNGLTAQQILGGAAKAAIELAAAAGSQLDPAAAAVTDTMANFKKTTADLPAIVNQITGAVNQSKFDFDDFRLAMGSAGGVAGKVGVSFEDFAAVLAGTSASFSSGEDAGTSFKTMLMAIGSPSSTAAGAIERLGLNFFDATGKMKSMADIAQMLSDKLGGLSDQQKLSAVGDIFGNDASRTALALMELSGKGIDDIKSKIEATNAAAQSADRLKGFNGQLEQLRGSFETLAITIGQSGILETVTGLVVGLAGIIDKLSEADPALLNFAVTVGVVMAAIGPFLIAIGSIMSAVGGLIPIFIKLAPVIGAIVPVLATLGRALLSLAIAGGPLTLVALAVGAVYLAWQNWDKIVAIVRAVYTAAKTWLVDKMNVVFDAVRAKVKSVGDAFYELWDRVVGHSYVPDLVDGVSAEFNRLRDVMTRPAEAETERTGEAFLGLAQNVEGSMNSIIRAVKSGDVSGILGGLSGLLGAGKSIFSIFTSSKTTPSGGTAPGGGALSIPDIPMFATGGSFRVGGSGGVDSQLMQFYATPGEMVDVRKGNDRGERGGMTIQQSITFSGGVDLATRSEVYRVAEAVKASTMAAQRDAGRRRG